MPDGQKLWHVEIITEETKRAFGGLAQTSVLGSFYLAGGTGLALHLGHRRSRDLDFFSEGGFETDQLVNRLRDYKEPYIIAKGEGTLHVDFEGTKVSFLSYPYPTLFNTEPFLGIRVADSRDIACMKLSAIASRGTKRDFIDLHAVAGLYGLPQLLDWFAEKFRPVSHSYVHLLKSLTYFDDADREPMPDMLTSLSWDEVKRFFGAEARKLV